MLSDKKNKGQMLVVLQTLLIKPMKEKSVYIIQKNVLKVPLNHIMIKQHIKSNK